MAISRRTFLERSVITTGALGLASLPMIAKQKPTTRKSSDDKFSIHIFSKHLHWLGYEEMAKAAKSMGFDGIDLTVRPGGHVTPENVLTDLPLAMKAIRRAGLSVKMVTTAITSADDPLTDNVLRACSQEGIQYYRMGWINYETKKSIAENMEMFKTTFQKLEALNKKYNIHGAYQNHSGMNLGSPVWDLFEVLKDLDPNFVGCQFDVHHATVEGANSWPLGLQLLHPFIKTIDVKDFEWTKTNEGWKVKGKPLGKGMVDFNHFFSLLNDYQIKCPVSLHFEYPLGGAESGEKKISILKDEVMGQMQNDLQLLRSWIQK